MSTNRNSTPDQTSGTSLRPPTSRPLGSGHHLRASADMSSFSSPLNNRIRPASEIFLNAPQIQSQNSESDQLDKVAQKWLADLDSYETTLQDMATAAQDQDFKDELSAIEEWFRVLSEAERTAALYALLQQATQVQIRFFLTVLQQMHKQHPMSGLLSPADFNRDAMSNRLSAAMENLDISRNSLDQTTIASMYPDAAQTLENHKQRLQASGNGTKSNRNSAIFENRTNLTIQTPTITTSSSSGKDTTLPPPSPWRTSHQDTETKPANQSVGQMGNWQAPPPSAGLRSPRPPITGSTNIQTTTITAPSNSGMELPPLSPYDGAGGNWASMVNTPVVPVFNTGVTNPGADMVANATAMKLAALSTVNNRILLDTDAPKYKRRVNKTGENGQPLPSPRPQMQSPGMPMQSPANIVMYNEHGQPIPINAAAAAVAAAQAAQGNIGAPGQMAGMGQFGMGGMGQMGQMGGLGGLGAMGARRSRPNSPAIAAFQSPLGFGFASPQNNGFLTALAPGEGYLSDDVSGRGRSPRGRRGSSKPPEDPTDINLLNDIPLWLRSLRLHKYTDNLKDLNWETLIELSDEDLEKRGVNALGARRKMLKVFDQVKEAKKEGKIKGVSASSSS